MGEAAVANLEKRMAELEREVERLGFAVRELKGVTAAQVKYGSTCRVQNLNIGELCQE